MCWADNFVEEDTLGSNPLMAKKKATKPKKESTFGEGLDDLDDVPAKPAKKATKKKAAAKKKKPAKKKSKPKVVKEEEPEEEVVEEEEVAEEEAVEEVHAKAEPSESAAKESADDAKADDSKAEATEEPVEEEEEIDYGPDDEQALAALKRLGARLDVNEKNGNVWRVFLYEHHGTDAALLMLAGLPGLKEVWAMGTKCTEEGINALKEERPKLTVHF